MENIIFHSFPSSMFLRRSSSFSVLVIKCDYTREAKKMHPLTQIIQTNIHFIECILVCRLCLIFLLFYSVIAADFNPADFSADCFGQFIYEFKKARTLVGRKLLRYVLFEFNF